MHIKLTDIILQESFLQKIKQGISSVIGKIQKVFSNLSLGEKETISIDLSQYASVTEVGKAGSLGGVLAEYHCGLQIHASLVEAGITNVSVREEEFLNKISELETRLQDTRVIEEETAAGKRMGIVIAEEFLKRSKDLPIVAVNIKHSGSGDHTDKSDLILECKKAGESSLTRFFGLSLKTAPSNNAYLLDKSGTKVIMDLIGLDYVTPTKSGTKRYNRDAFAEAMKEDPLTYSLFTKMYSHETRVDRDDREKKGSGSGGRMKDIDQQNFYFDQDIEKYREYSRNMALELAKLLNQHKTKLKEVLFGYIGINDNTFLVQGYKNSPKVLSTFTPEVYEVFDKWKNSAELEINVKDSVGKPSQGKKPSTGVDLEITVDGSPLMYFQISKGFTYHKFRVNWKRFKDYEIEVK